MKASHLLSNEISRLDINDEAKNKNYTKEIGILFNEINTDLRKADITGTLRVSEEELLALIKFILL